jgi:carbon monoxide dehydrogenase subunit G
MSTGVLTGFANTIDIAAPPDQVWSVLIDVERWPEWTPSMTSIERFDAGPFVVGSRVHIQQPKLLPATWTITELAPGKSFTWVTGRPGLHVIARHRIEPTYQASRVTFSVEFEGLLLKLVGRTFRKINEEYLQMQASGLKWRCEVQD